VNDLVPTDEIPADFLEDEELVEPEPTVIVRRGGQGWLSNLERLQRVADRYREDVEGDE
jgi:hypothetical protein